MGKMQKKSRTWMRGLCAGAASLALAAFPVTSARAQDSGSGSGLSADGARSVAGSGDGQVVNPGFDLGGTGTANPAGWTTTGSA
jgi:hypothetical protein